VTRLSWTVLGEDYAVAGPVDRFLAHLNSVDRSPTTMRSYAFDLRDSAASWQIDVTWDAVRLEDLGRFVGRLRQSPAELAGNVAQLLRADGTVFGVDGRSGQPARPDSYARMTRCTRVLTFSFASSLLT
jgi:hypothetical protein